MSEPKELVAIRLAERKVMKGRYCTSCRSIQPESYGEQIKNRTGHTRWRCFKCSQSVVKRK